MSERAESTFTIPGATVWSGRQAIDRQVRWPGPPNTPITGSSFNAAESEMTEWAGFQATPLIELSELARSYKTTVFEFGRHREPKHYGLIVERKGGNPAAANSVVQGRRTEHHEPRKESLSS